MGKGVSAQHARPQSLRPGPALLGIRKIVSHLLVELGFVFVSYELAVEKLIASLDGVTQHERARGRGVEDAIRSKSIFLHGRPVIVQENVAPAVVLPQESVLDVFAANTGRRDEHSPMRPI